MQLLANRGYAVLQVDARGSVGHGRAHTQAGIGEFAAAMHTDLLDAVDWAVEQGWADPDRAAVFGSSYGGYAALVGAMFTPERFAAAVDVAGTADLATFLDELSPSERAAAVTTWFRYAGDPADPRRRADLLSRSPIDRLARTGGTTVPLLVAQGADDARAVAGSDRLVTALREAGAEVDYHVYDDEGHRFTDPDTRIAFHRAADRFLARHLGGRCEPGGR
ncbi:alpha/beta hydrolase family protein [Pseudonocardia sp. HH130630-07]|uniref:alpha/beta hydrolase family protein n=1 Tax=Pseudonocardia sp. HH130630-07 TaxID=1690815 RepID=UPI001E4A43DC|nr:prolyl oligopeptidase family serine peptidase [Pseudonocardia sp. HH130630-07]